MSAIFLDFGNLGFQKLGFPVRNHLMFLTGVSYIFLLISLCKLLKFDPRLKVESSGKVDEA